GQHIPAPPCGYGRGAAVGYVALVAPGGRRNAMAEVQTVQGPVDGGDLGVVLIHEHVRFRDEAVADQWPGAYDPDEEMSAALEAEGVDLSRVQIAHTGDTDDLDYIESLLGRRVFIGMDRYGLEMFLPMDRRNATVAELLRRGYADRMFLSADSCATIDWFPPEA